MRRYNPKEIEPKWQQIWDDQQIYKADLMSQKPKYMAMSMFNYPSGAGIHIGHAMNYTISDVKARFKRQLGHESYHPIGWDAFGLPAENYAIKAGVSPQQSMASIIPSYHKQYKAMGWSNDWSKEIATYTPEYYKWTQWIFSQMYQRGLAYQDSRMQWWCEKDKTVLANEQIVDGKCWRHDGPDDPLVEQKEVKQWFFKITEYADELLEAIDDLDWTESVKLAQKNWIGRSTGAEITFTIEGRDEAITVFTTRADTLYGATFLVLAPEHELVESITTTDCKAAVNEYVKAAQLKTEVERQASKEKSGVFTGAYATNPVTSKTIPIWIADYVLTGYGTGAIMAVPAHDQRDHAFATTYNLPIITVVNPTAVREDAKDKPVDVSKAKIVAVVTNTAGELLTINWGEKGGRLFVGGTVEGDEPAEQTALREVTEETGYTDLKVESVGDETFFYKYFAFSKNETHETEVKFVRLTLQSDAQQAQNLDESEKNNFTVEWVDHAQADREITEPLHRYAFDKFITRECFHGEGLMTNSGVYDGKDSFAVRDMIIDDLAQSGLATAKTNYKMRDWSVSRQRYWGAPIPIIHCNSCGIVPVPDTELPVVLPEMTEFAPSGDGRGALARATEWLQVPCPSCGGDAERETDTLDTYICSSWYMFRYLDPANTEKIFDSAVVNNWAPVDFYNGGDHATAHLLYARFITRFFTKIGIMENPEPFKQMLFNGKVMASDGSAFSKSKGNGVDPLDIISQGYGADALRMYLMFAAPLEFSARWDPQGVPGTYRFLSRVWTLVQEYLALGPTELDESVQKKLRHTTHTMIKKMTEDINENRYNTAIAAAMAATNDFYKLKTTQLGAHEAWQGALEALVSCIAPFAPHIADELWAQLGKDTSVQKDSWPQLVSEYLQTDTLTVVVQVNGKLRGDISVAPDATEEEITTAAKAHDRVAAAIGNSEIRKTIYVPGKIVNFVV